jgi:hypothetical protein
MQNDSELPQTGARTGRATVGAPPEERIKESSRNNMHWFPLFIRPCQCSTHGHLKNAITVHIVSMLRKRPNRSTYPSSTRERNEADHPVVYGYELHLVSCMREPTRMLQVLPGADSGLLRCVWHTWHATPPTSRHTDV